MLTACLAFAAVAVLVTITPDGTSVLWTSLLFALIHNAKDIEVAQVCRVVDMVLRASHQVSGEGWRRIITIAPPTAA